MCLTGRPDRLAMRPFLIWRAYVPPGDESSAGGEMAEDALSDLLRTVRLTGATFFEIAASGVWAVQSPDRRHILPKILPGADHLIAYHVVTAGQCYGTIGGGEPVLLEAGQAIVFTNAAAH